MIKNRASALLIDLDGAAAPIRDRVILFRLLMVLAGQLRARMDGRLRGAGVTSQQAAVLALASTAPPPTQGQVARLLGVTHQNVRQIMDALVRKGLLEVYTDAGDRRANRLVATRRVARLFARRNADDFAAVADWFSALDDREVASLVAQLGRVLTALNPRSDVEGTSADAPRRGPRRTSRPGVPARRRRPKVT